MYFDVLGQPAPHPGDKTLESNAAAGSWFAQVESAVDAAQSRRRNAAQRSAGAVAFAQRLAQASSGWSAVRSDAPIGVSA